MVHLQPLRPRGQAGRRDQSREGDGSDDSGSTGSRDPRTEEWTAATAAGNFRFVTPQRSTWPLRELCRKRLVNEMIGSVCSSIGSAVGYWVLVLDTTTFSLVKSVCSRLAPGMAVEQIHYNRTAPLPGFRAVYFVEPTFENIKRIAEDVSDDGPGYESVYVFFTRRADEARLKELTPTPILQKVAELNLSFLPYDDRCFHLSDQRQAFRELLEARPPPLEQLLDVAAKLSTLPLSLGVRPKIVFSRRSVGSLNGRTVTGAGVCERLARELQARFEELETQNPPWKEPPSDHHPRPTSCTMLIVDRTIDWMPLLLHDIHYEAMMGDVLGEDVDLNVGKFRYEQKDVESGEVSKTDVFLSANMDSIWSACRHAPYWRARERILDELQAVQAQILAIRAELGAPHVGGGGGLGSQSSSALARLNKVQLVPELTERRGKSDMHSFFCVQCVQAVSHRKLDDVAPFEQDLATGVSADGLSNGPSGGVRGLPLWHFVCPRRAVFGEMRLYLKDPELPDQVKLRLFLLFIASDAGLQAPEPIVQELASLLPTEEDKRLALSSRWRNAQRWEHSREMARRRQHVKDHIADLKLRMANQTRSHHAQRLRRWQPRMKDLVERLFTNTLLRDGDDEFVELQVCPSPATQFLKTVACSAMSASSAAAGAGGVTGTAATAAGGGGGGGGGGAGVTAQEAVGISSGVSAWSAASASTGVSGYSHPHSNTNMNMNNANASAAGAAAAAVSSASSAASSSSIVEPASASNNNYYNNNSNYYNNNNYNNNSDFEVASSASGSNAGFVGGGARDLQSQDEGNGGHCIIVFIVGGVTLSEARVAHEMSRRLGVEVLVGGSCMLTPDMLPQTLRTVVR